MLTMRLIDADKLEELCDIMAEKCDGIGKSVWHQFRTTVEWSPIVDAVPVVRCKECKHNYANMIPGGEGCAKCIELPITPDFYCKNGERREEEHE